jgi:cytochrome c-type biogenesis protein CcmH/NrfF
MLNLRKFKAVLLVGFAAAFCVAQTASEYETPQINGIAKRLNCNCGCHLDMACVMPPSGVCPVCKENKIRIANMLKSGMSEQQVLDQYVKDQGPGVLVVPPGMLGFTGPYIALALGGLALYFVIRRLKTLKPAPAVAPANDAELAKYQAQIDKDLDKLD